MAERKDRSSIWGTSVERSSSQFKGEYPCRGILTRGIWSATLLDFVSIQVELVPILESMKRQQKKRAKRHPRTDDLQEWFVQLRIEVVSVIISNTGNRSAVAPSVSKATITAQKFTMMVRYSSMLIDMNSNLCCFLVEERALRDFIWEN